MLMYYKYKHFIYRTNVKWIDIKVDKVSITSYLKGILEKVFQQRVVE